MYAPPGRANGGGGRWRGVLAWLGTRPHGNRGGAHRPRATKAAAAANPWFSHPAVLAAALLLVLAGCVWSGNRYFTRKARSGAAIAEPPLNLQLDLQQHAADEMLLRQIVDECATRQDTTLFLSPERELVVDKALDLTCVLCARVRVCAHVCVCVCVCAHACVCVGGGGRQREQHLCMCMSARSRRRVVWDAAAMRASATADATAGQTARATHPPPTHATPSPAHTTTRNNNNNNTPSPGTARRWTSCCVVLSAAWACAQTWRCTSCTRAAASSPCQPTWRRTMPRAAPAQRACFWRPFTRSS
jgi:hypothetical protein